MLPDKKGYFGEFGGAFITELLIPAVQELEVAYLKSQKDKKFKKQLDYLYTNYANRPTLLYYANNLSDKLGAKIYLKREDLLHTGAHKINNTIGQVLLAKTLKKKRIIAETGAGQHGVATATACALLDLPCKVYMGHEDLRRQELNVFRMRLLGAEVQSVGVKKKGTLRDAINEALRDWATNLDTTHYVIGSAIGPHPFPMIVRDFQSVIGIEARKQILAKEGKLPDAIFACVGGGSNAIGLFHAFRKDLSVQLIGVEAGGHNTQLGNHSATLCEGTPGILHGCLTYLLQNQQGFISETNSVSAGLDYPGVGPEHAYLKQTQRAKYVQVSNDDALKAFQMLSKLEGIIPALETSHPIAYLKKWIKQNKKNVKEPLLIVNLSGRGDKDVSEVLRILEAKD